MDRTRDRLLRVDLTDETVESERVPARWRRRFLGGKGLGARYLYDELPPGADPLGPENALAFLLGPLTGYLPGESRFAAVTKSPLTGTFLDSYCGGAFPGALAGALDDHLGVLVVGTADDPVVLSVADGEAALERCPDLWGADAAATCEAFPDAAVACVGPAGERRVSYATIASDGADHHAGRGGAGAVMGAKRLKAVVARGDPPDGLSDLRERYEARYEADATGRWRAAGGTVESVDFADEVGVLSTRGWQEGSFDGAEGVGVDAVSEAASGRERPDDAVPGDFRVETDAGESVPRGATGMTLGAGLGVDEFDAVAELGEACNRLGVDVISAGNVVAWAVRAAEAGHVDRDLSFGDPAAARDLLSEIATRETPLGDALADGVERAAERFGGDGLVPTVKAMELPSYDPRGAASMALAYATSDRGACHRRARPVEREVFDPEPWGPAETARAVATEQDARSVLWSLIVDDFAGDALDDFGAELLAALGRSYDRDELAAVGERVWTLVRLFNVREGVTREDDALPAALLEPLQGGPADGSAVDEASFEAALDAYYARRGWDALGRPTRETLDRLGLSGLVDAETPVGDAPAAAPDGGATDDR